MNCKKCKHYRPIGNCGFGRCKHPMIDDMVSKGSFNWNFGCKLWEGNMEKCKHELSLRCFVKKIEKGLFIQYTILECNKCKELFYTEEFKKAIKVVPS